MESNQSASFKNPKQARKSKPKPNARFQMNTPSFQDAGVFFGRIARNPKNVNSINCKQVEVEFAEIYNVQKKPDPSSYS